MRLEGTYKRERSRVGGSCDPGGFGVEAKQMHLFSTSSGFVRANEVAWIECISATCKVGQFCRLLIAVQRLVGLGNGTWVGNGMHWMRCLRALSLIAYLLRYSYAC